MYLLRRALLLLAVAIASLGSFLVLLQSVHAQATPTVRVTAPSNGGTFSNPVTVSVTTSGAIIKAATDNDPGAAHLHYFIDRDPATVIQPGQPIPSGQPDIIHTPDLSLAMPTLAPGTHNVWVVLAHTDHTPYSPNVQDRVTFTIGAGAAAAPGAPVTGRGGLLRASSVNGDDQTGDPGFISAAPIALGAALLGAALIVFISARRRGS